MKKCQYAFTIPDNHTDIHSNKIQLYNEGRFKSWATWGKLSYAF